ncbi:Hypothetical protein A7982_11358 [Minicystis rosea]|nr:Hypothetical protein A7982_11358 [Minicystis rosea]
MSVYSLDHLARVLSSQISIPAVYNSINTRLIIQTGVNLKKLSPEQCANRELLQKVLAALDKMGVTVEETK